jgi:hypothetical protein
MAALCQMSAMPSPVYDESDKEISCGQWCRAGYQKTEGFYRDRLGRDFIPAGPERKYFLALTRRHECEPPPR